MAGNVTQMSRHANGTIRRINERKIDLTGPPQMGLRPKPQLLGADYSSLSRPGGVGKRDGDARRDASPARLPGSGYLRFSTPSCPSWAAMSSAEVAGFTCL